MYGGEGGIRTLGVLAHTHDFQSCTFGHSVTSPSKTQLIASNGLAERAGFEPAVGSHPHLISNQAPSTSRTPLRRRSFAKNVARTSAHSARLTPLRT